MDYDIFSQSPREKFFDILFNANKNLVENELEKTFEKFIGKSEVCERLNDIYIGLSGDILSQNE